MTCRISLVGVLDSAAFSARCITLKYGLVQESHSRCRAYRSFRAVLEGVLVSQISRFPRTDIPISQFQRGNIQFIPEKMTNIPIFQIDLKPP